MQAEPLDRALGLAAREVRLLCAVTPENLREERARIEADLARGRDPVPRFTYAPSDRRDLRLALETMRKWSERRLPPELAPLYLARIEELDLEARIAESAGRPALGPLATRRFGETDAGAAHEARELARAWLALAPPRERGPRVQSDAAHPDSLLSLMRAEIGGRRLSFRVETSSWLVCRAATGERTIWIAAGRLLTRDEARRTVLHEVLGHAVPRARSEAGPAILSIGTARGADDQEGLAVLLEERHGLIDAGRRRELGARHVAVERMAAGASYPDVARHLVREGGLSPASALDVCDRTFRGSDGTGPGLGRERIYLGAWLRVRAHLARKPKDESILASGQVALAAIPALTEGRRRSQPSTSPFP